MIIDTHVHCFPDKIARNAVETLAAKSPELNYCTDGTLLGVLASMEASGVDVSVICPVATNPGQTAKVNDYSIRINGVGGIVALGALHPDQRDWKDELKRIRDAGLAGIKLHPDYQDFYVDEPRMLPVYEACVRMGLVIVFHAGVDLGYPDPVHCPPHRFRRVAERVDTSRFVLAHMGAWSMWDEVEEYLVGQDVYFDTAYCFGHITEEQFLRMARLHGINRILFATDSPWKEQSIYLRHLRALPLEPGEYEAIAGGNAQKLFGINDKAVTAGSEQDNTG